MKPKYIILAAALFIFCGLLASNSAAAAFENSWPTWSIPAIAWLCLVGGVVAFTANDSKP